MPSLLMPDVDPSRVADLGGAKKAAVDLDSEKKKASDKIFFSPSSSEDGSDGLGRYDTELENIYDEGVCAGMGYEEDGIGIGSVEDEDEEEFFIGDTVRERIVLNPKPVDTPNV